MVPPPGPTPMTPAEAAAAAEALAEKMTAINTAMGDMAPKMQRSFTATAVHLEKMYLAGSKVPGLFDKMTRRGTALAKTLQSIPQEIGNFLKMAKEMDAAVALLNIGLAVLVNGFKLLAKAMKVATKVAKALASALIDVLVGALKMAYKSVKYLYDGFIKLGETIFDFNLAFNKLLDEQTAGFVKLTQAGREYTGVIDGTVDSLRFQGLAIADVAKNAAQLYETTVLFRDATGSTRVQLARFVSVLDQAGIGAESTSKMIQILNKTYGDTGEQTMSATERLIQFARAAGISGRTAAADFANAATVITAHGEGIEEVFKGLITQSRATGLSMSELLGVAGEFDTFDKSAQAVGRLNAMLGGPYLNSIEMVYMTENQRVRAVLASIEASGKSWRSMGRFEKQAFAAAAGIRDMNKANDLFAGGLGAFDRAALQAEKNKKKQDALAATAKRATDIWTNFMNTLQGFAVSFRPIIEIARQWIEKLAAVDWQHKQAIGKVGILAAGIAMLSKWFGPLGLVGSLILLYDNWDRIKKEFLGDKGAAIIGSYLEKIKGFVKKVPEYIALVAGHISRIWTDMKEDEEFAQGLNDFKIWIIKSFTEIATMIGLVLKAGITRGLIDAMSVLEKVGVIKDVFGWYDLDVGAAATQIKRSLQASAGGAPERAKLAKTEHEIEKFTAIQTQQRKQYALVKEMKALGIPAGQMVGVTGRFTVEQLAQDLANTQLHIQELVVIAKQQTTDLNEAASLIKPIYDFIDARSESGARPVAGSEQSGLPAGGGRR